MAHKWMYTRRNGNIHIVPVGDDLVRMPGHEFTDHCSCNPTENASGEDGEPMYVHHLVRCMTRTLGLRREQCIAESEYEE